MPDSQPNKRPVSASLARTFAVATSFLVSTLAVAGNGVADHFTPIHVNDLSQMLSTKTSDLYVMDVNNAQTRDEYGSIPGAKMLTYSTFNPAKDLPTDKSSKLVFYCANTKCMASHEAANKAAGAGYSNVYVMVDGIQGWAKAKKPVEKSKS